MRLIVPASEGRWLGLVHGVAALLSLVAATRLHGFSAGALLVLVAGVFAYQSWRWHSAYKSWQAGDGRPAPSGSN